jgi:hypothetical protein
LSSRNENQDEAMEASASDFEDRELAAALEKSKAETSGTTSTSGAASTSASGGQPDAKLTVLQTDKFTEENVQTLIKYGFSRDKVIKKLFFLQVQYLMGNADEYSSS